MTNHHLGKKGEKGKKKKKERKTLPSFAGTSYSFQPPRYGGGADISRGKNACT